MYAWHLECHVQCRGTGILGMFSGVRPLYKLFKQLRQHLWLSSVIQSHICSHDRIDGMGVVVVRWGWGVCANL